MGHVCPGAVLGGPLVALRDGDVIEIDIANRVLNARRSDDELQARLDEWVPPLHSRTLSRCSLRLWESPMFLAPSIDLCLWR